jgi:DNA polymerase/3'-5' exonuclease PolX
MPPVEGGGAAAGGPATEHPATIRCADRGVEVRIAEASLKAAVDFNEVAGYIRRMCPWCEGKYVAIRDDVIEIRDRTIYARAVVYILARRSRLTVSDAEYVASVTHPHEVEAIADALMYRLYLCLGDAACEHHIVNTFIKIVETYRGVLPY